MLAIIEIQNKTIIGELEQLESEPSIVVNNSYEIIKNLKTKQNKYVKYPQYAMENIAVFNSVHILTIYPVSDIIRAEYDRIASTESTSELELLLE